ISIGEYLDLRRSQARKYMHRDVAEQAIAQPIDSFEMLEEQHQLFHLGERERFVRPVERMRHSVRQLFLYEIPLHLVEILAQFLKVLMLPLSDSPHEKVNLGSILGKPRADLHRYERS